MDLIRDIIDEWGRIVVDASDKKLLGGCGCVVVLVLLSLAVAFVAGWFIALQWG